jgi:hypothetical protein
MMALMVVALALFLAPVAAIAAGGFTDVGDDNVFKGDIEWLAKSGVTKGCNPPTNDKYCPDNHVTRGQMAAFMHRLAVNKVVDAKTSMDAGKLDGKDSTAFVQKGEADSVSSSMLANPPGVTQSIDAAHKSLTTTAATIEAVALDAPAAGHVLVQVAYQVVITHVNGQSDFCQLALSSTDATLPSDVDPDFFVDGDIPTGTLSLLSAASRVYPVAGAGTHTFYFVGKGFGGCQVDDIILSALYVPVAYG